MEGLGLMANRRTISRAIAQHTGLEPRQTEKIIRTYFTILSAVEGAGLGKLGQVKRRISRRRRRPVMKFTPSEGLRRAAEEGTLPPAIRRLIDSP